MTKLKQLKANLGEMQSLRDRVAVRFAEFEAVLHKQHLEIEELKTTNLLQHQEIKKLRHVVEGMVEHSIWSEELQMFELQATKEAMEIIKGLVA